MKEFLTISVLLLLIEGLFAQPFNKQTQDSIIDDQSLQKMINNFNTQQYDKILKKVYVHFNKSIYYSGETINLSSYIVELGSHQLSFSSNILYVDMISSSGKIIIKKQFLIKDGISEGSIDIPPTVNSDIYYVRAYTNWMKNFDADYFYYHPILIINSLSNQTTSKIKAEETLDFNVQFFPEGGNYVKGIPARIGFKVVDQNGKGIYVSGKIIDDSGQDKFSVDSRHDGMGSFSFIPGNNEIYFLEIEWKNITKKFNLPIPLNEGLVLRANNLSDEVIHVLISPSEAYYDTEVLLVGQCRGKLYFSEKVIVKKEGSVVLIPKSILPEGILQITLFDSNLIPSCERLVYIKKPKSHHISIESQTDSLEKREKVELTITIVDENKEPVKNTSLSIAINDADQDNKSYNDKAIDNYLLLTSDLKGEITNPGYYLKNNLRDTNIDLDLLMLIHGWRRFTWEKIENKQLPDFIYDFQKAIRISGTAFKEGSENPLKNGLISILSLTDNYPFFLQSSTDNDGRFSFDGILLPENVEVITKSVNKSGRRINIDLEFDETISYPVEGNLINQHRFQSDSEISIKGNYPISIRENTDVFGEGILLDEITIKGEKFYVRRFSKPDASIIVTEQMEIYTDIFLLMKGKIPALQISGSGESTKMRIRGFSMSPNAYPLIILDGIPLNSSEAGQTTGFIVRDDNVPPEIDVNPNSSINSILLSIHPSDVERIDVLTTVAATSIYGFTASNGVILIYTKKGSRNYENKRTKGYKGFHLPGYNIAREFYSPVYESDDEKHDPFPDFRQTLFWTPNIRTDKEGRIQISFYNSDICKTMQIDIQGITPDGNPIRYLIIQ